jgi:hypothetical protein
VLLCFATQNTATHGTGQPRMELFA